MKLQVATLILLLVSLGVSSDDQGTLRLNNLRKRSLESSNRIINFQKADFEYLPLHVGNT
jgi:hypothetical protein